MKKLIILLALVFTSLVSLAQTNEDNEITGVINHLFESMKNFDTAGVRSCFYAGAQMQTATPRLKRTALRNQSAEDFIQQIASLKSDTLKVEEKVSSFEVHSDGLIASVWAPYEFYMNGKLQHTGVNSFQLFRTTADGWKIIYICDTRRRK
jgi:hypothetical protein